MDFLQNYQDIVAKAIEKYTFKNKPTELYAPLNYIIANSGKRIRPVMALMACDLLGGDVNSCVKPALAIEYFHNFTLIHDDIMDEAPLRRGKPTLHTLYGNNTGILSGDALMLKAYTFFEDLEPNIFKACMRVFTHSGLLLCEGQQYDVNFESLKEVSFNEYIRMITYKTGILTACAFEIGALIAKANTQDAKALFNFGKHLGIAFQIMDDYLDVFGDMEKFGKKQAGDIYENKKTVLYLFAKEFANEEERKELDFWYAKKTDNVDKIYGVERIFRRTKADEKTLRLVEKHNQIAHEYLMKVNTPEEKKRPLKELANFLLNRDK